MEKKKKTISTLTAYSIHFAFRVEKKKKSLGELDSRSCLVLDNCRVIYFFPPTSSSFSGGSAKRVSCFQDLRVSVVHPPQVIALHWNIFSNV